MTSELSVLTGIDKKGKKREKLLATAAVAVAAATANKIEPIKQLRLVRRGSDFCSLL